MKTSIFKCFIFILNIFFDYFICPKHCFCYHFVNIVPLVIITTAIVNLLLYSSNTPPPSPNAPLIKGSRGWTFSKLMALWDLKTVARKGGLFSLGMGGCHINYITVFLEVIYDGT